MRKSRTTPPGRQDAAPLGRLVAVMCLLATTLVTAFGAERAAGDGGGATPTPTILATPNPVQINQTFILSSVTTLLAHNTNHDYLFFRRILPSTDILVDQQNNLLSSPTGSLGTQTPNLTPPGVGQFFYYARVRESANHSVFYDSPLPLLTLTVTGGVTVDAEPASKLFPTFRATVTPVAPATLAPTGTVQFQVGGTTVCSDDLDGSGNASCHVFGVFLASSYTASYSGDAYYPAASDTAPLVIFPGG